MLSAFFARNASRSLVLKYMRRAKERTAIPPSIPRFTSPIASVAKCQRREWKTQSGFQKRSTARFPRCWRRRQRSPIPSSTFREGWRSSAARLFLYRKRGVSLGNFSDPWPRGIYRASAARWRTAQDFTGKYRPLSPITESSDHIAGSVVADIAHAKRNICTPGSWSRSVAVFSAWHSGSGGVELFLLPRDSANERRDSHHSAIHGAGLGADLYGSARSTTAFVAEKLGSWTCRGRLCISGRPSRLRWFPHRWYWNDGRDTGCIFFRLLQRRRPRSAGPLRPLESTAMGASGNVNVLDFRKSAVENSSGALRSAAVGIHAGIFPGFCARTVFLLLRRPAASGAHPRHRHQLSGAGL